MAKRPTGRTRYYSSNSTGVKRGEEVLRSVQQPKKPTKPISQDSLRASVARIGAPNRNAPVQKLRYYRKKR